MECIAKILVFGTREYFADNWNRLDFIVVLEGVTSAIIVSIQTMDHLKKKNTISPCFFAHSHTLPVLQSVIPGVSTEGPIQSLRLLRLFRPLRALGKLKV